LYWRLHFAFGSVAHTIGNSHLLSLISGGKCNLSDPPAVFRRMEAFMLAGLQAPVEEVVKC